MAEIINLRQVRKVKKRAEAQQQAEANRLKHGRTKAEKRQIQQELHQQERLLDGAKRETILSFPPKP